MARFFFNVITASATIPDAEGTELPGLEEAREEALKDARTLMSHAILEGRDISGRHIEVRNEIGDLLLIVEFADAFRRFE
jgi:hypothetical protein